MELVNNLLLFQLLPEIPFFLDIFKYKNINNVINLYCEDAKSAVLIQKSFIDHHIRISNIIIPDSNDTFEIPHDYVKTGFIVNASCIRWPIIFKKLNYKNIFKPSYAWFIKTVNLSSALYTLRGLPVEVDSDVSIVYKKQEKLFDVYEVYHTGFYNHGTFKVNKIGYWNSKLRIDKNMRVNLSGVVLKGVAVITEKVADETFEEYIERSRLSKSDTLHRLKYFTLLKYMRDMYNFSYALLRTDSWGYLHNGSFDGMIGTLQRQEADIGCAPVLFRLERAEVVDAAMEVWKSRPLFIMRHPKHPGGYYAIFSRPLTSKVWFSILALLTISWFILFLMINLKALRTEYDDEDPSLSWAVLTVWGAICQQGTVINRGSTSIKLVIFVTFVFTLTIYQYYNATVVSTLLKEPPKNIRTPNDLLKSKLKTGVHDVLYNKDFFKRTTDPVALEIYNTKITTPTGYNFFTLEDGMALVKRGGFAFLVDNTIAYGVMRKTFTERELCDAHEVTLYPPESMAAIVRKGSPYREHFTYGLRRTFEAGLMHRIKSVWDEPKPACVRTPDTSLIAVSIREFSMALILLLGGIISALIILACEIGMYSLRQHGFARRWRRKTDISHLRNN